MREPPVLRLPDPGDEDELGSACGVCPKPLEGARGCALGLMLCSWCISCAACQVSCRHP